MSLRKLLAAAFLAAFPTSALADGNAFLLPRSQHPLEQFHNNFRARTPELTGAGKLSFQAIAAWSNTYNSRRRKFEIDEETRRGELVLAYGLNEMLELTFETTVPWRGAGILDSGIKEYDRLLGFPNRRRDRRADDQYEVRGTNEDGTIFDIERDGAGIGDSFAGAVFKLADENTDGYAAALQFELRLPTASEGFGQDSVDGTWTLLLGKNFNGLALSGGAGISLFGDRFEQGIQFKREHLFAYLTAETPLFAETSAYISSSVATPQTEKLPFTPDLFWMLDLGLRAPLTETLNLSVGFRENPLHPQATTDFTGYLALAFRAP